MPSLRELQRNFAAAIMFDDRAAIASLDIVPGAIEPARRIAIYRNNVLGNYRRALAATYPVVRALVGAAFFDAACDAFVRVHASDRGDVNGYGGDFARFVRSYAPARDLEYLPDVAQLEWAVDQANIAADAAPLDIAALGRVPLEDLSRLQLELHPSVRLLVSPFPVLHIWRVNQLDFTGDDRVDLGEGGDDLLVRRETAMVVIERIERGDHAFLNAIAANASLAAAATLAAEADPDFDIVRALRRHVRDQTIVAFRPLVAAPVQDRA